MRDSLTAFAISEARRPNYLDDWSDLILFAYLAPFLFKGSNLKPEEADGEFASVLRKYMEKVGRDLPQHLQEFYDRIPQETATSD